MAQLQQAFTDMQGSQLQPTPPATQPGEEQAAVPTDAQAPAAADPAAPARAMAEALAGMVTMQMQARRFRVTAKRASPY